jgi:hypothetical protein
LFEELLSSYCGLFFGTTVLVKRTFERTLLLPKLLLISKRQIPIYKRWSTDQLHFRKSEAREHVRDRDINTTCISSILLHFFVAVYLTKMFARARLHESVLSRDLTEITLTRVLSYDISNTCCLFGAALLQNSTKFSLRASRMWTKRRFMEV